MIIFGTRAKVKTIGHLTMRCPLCGVTCAQALREGQRYFTLFFVPIVPFSHSEALVCSSCGQGHKIDKATAEQMKQYLAGHPIAGAGMTYGPAPSGPPGLGAYPPPGLPPPPAALAERVPPPPPPSPDAGWAPPESWPAPATGAAQSGATLPDPEWDPPTTPRS